MSSKFHGQITQFMDLIHQLDIKGIKKKEVAQQLDLYPSVYSALINVVFKKILALDPEQAGIDDAISQAFQEVNNISEKRIRREIELFIQKLRHFKDDSERAVISESQHYVSKLKEASPVEKLNRLIGIYDCYYISSFGYQVKKEPFFIKLDNAQKQFEVQKGNAKSHAVYKGFLYFSNHQLLTIQLLELGAINQDNFIMHFSIPPFYSWSFHFLKGLGVSMANSFLPIARKILLVKKTTEVNMVAFDKMEIEFFEKEELNDSPEVVKYLYQSNSLIEFAPVPRPTYDEKDLMKEIKIETLV